MRDRWQNQENLFTNLNKAYAEFKSRENEYLPPESEEKFRSSWNEIYGNTIPVIAFYSFLNQDSDSFQLVKKSLDLGENKIY